MTAMLDCVVNSLRDGNHDIAVNVIVEMELVLRIVNEALNHSDVLRNGGHLDSNSLHAVTSDCRAS